ncbi:MAG TPA: TIGR04282 family arsenosugar biosynthesis glycosyltransferase [Usitatibacteraceae bacterium]|nr:TIGR04282 family arsenosugar biosynthesis glycosyltransferase [Usitatibacteraceae bacterium]
MAARRDSAVQVAVFAKAPVPGEVKTRLVGMLGPEGAAQLHATLARHALATAREAGVGPVSLWCAPDAGHPFFADCAAQYGVLLHDQRGAHLGERMARAFGQLLATGPALLLGSDCPSLDAGDLRAAAGSLATHDAVIQPAEDGGYVLVGLAREMSSIFEGIRWGGPDVMRDTRARLREASAIWREMPARWDVDRPEDYRRLLAAGFFAETGR